MDLKKHAHITKDFYVGDEAYAYDVLDIKVNITIYISTL